MTTKRYLVILDDRNLESIVYLGEVDGHRQGTRRANAVRFTRVGAYRVQAQYPGSRVVESAA